MAFCWIYVGALVLGGLVRSSRAWPDSVPQPASAAIAANAKIARSILFQRPSGRSFRFLGSCCSGSGVGGGVGAAFRHGDRLRDSGRRHWPCGSA